MACKAELPFLNIKVNDHVTEPEVYYNTHDAKEKVNYSVLDYAVKLKKTAEYNDEEKTYEPAQNRSQDTSFHRIINIDFDAEIFKCQRQKKNTKNPGSSAHAAASKSIAEDRGKAHH